MYFCYKNGLIGQSIPPYLIDTNYEFFVWEHKLFLESLETQPEDWIYRTLKIYYHFNEYGHRCKPIDQLNHDYFLFLGCSYTLGFGLRLEDTYPYLVSQHYNMDYYNLAICGGSINSSYYNLMSFLNLAKNKPKKIFIQWPFSARILLASKDDKFELFSINSYKNRYNLECYEPEVYETLLKHNVPHNQSMFYQKLVLDNLLNLGIEVFQVDLNSVATKVNNTNYMRLAQGSNDVLDRARDLAHPGIQTNLNWANKIIDFVDKKI